MLYSKYSIMELPLYIKNMSIFQGILWSLSILNLIHESEPSKYNRIINSTRYSENQALELATHGGISMLLTIINVLCIWIMGILLLKARDTI